MNIRELKYITAVAEHGNFGKAAQSCNISQPALSMQVRKLEDYLGVKIFERRNKQFLITPVGERLIEKAHEILRRADEFTEIARSAADPLAGRITIAAFPTLAPYYFPVILPLLAGEFPHLRLFLMEDKTARILKKLDNGEVDIAFLALPVAGDNYEKRELFEDRFLVAVSKNNPLAEKRGIKRDNLHGKKLLLLEEGHCLRDQALEFCEISGAAEVQEFRATSLETLRQMVAGDIGITLIPQIAAKGDDKLAYLEFTDGAPSRHIGMLWRKTNPRSEIFARIFALLDRLETAN